MINLGKNKVIGDEEETNFFEEETEQTEPTEETTHATDGDDFDSLLEASDGSDSGEDWEEWAEPDGESGLTIGNSSDKNLALQMIANLIAEGSVTDLHALTPPKAALSVGDRELFDQLLGYTSKFRKLPSRDDYEEFCKKNNVEFFGLPQPNTEQGLGFLFDKLMTQAQDEKLTGYIQKALIARGEGIEPLDRTRDLMHDLAGVLRLDPEVAKANPVAKAVAVGIRHKEKLLMKGAQGVPFGLPTFDKETGGFADNTVNIIAARPSVGKTFIALKAAIAAFRAKRRVKVYSMEMTEDQLWNRFFAMIAGIEANKISKFGLSTNEEKRLNIVISEFREMVESGEYYIDMKHPTGKFTPTDIYQECVRDEIDFLVVDAAYLVQHDNDYLNTKTWDKIREVINQIKLEIAAPLSIPVIATYQLIDEVDKYTDSDKITLGDLYGGDTMAQIASTVIALWQEPSRTDPRLYMKFLKGRDGEANLRGLWLNWIFETMAFDEWEETENLADAEL